MSLQKSEYIRYLNVPYGRNKRRAFEVNKTLLCDMARANACQRRAKWYGWANIGPRFYALYKCPEHGLLKKRI